MMVTNPQDYIFGEEIEIMEMLLARAEKRMKWFQQQEQNPNSCSCFRCQCEIYEQPPGTRKKPEGSCMADMQQLLGMVCQFCRDHDCCKCEERGRREEEELPF